VVVVVAAYNPDFFTLKEIIPSKEYFVQNRIHIPSKGKYKMEDIKVKNPFLSSIGKCYDPDYSLDKIDVPN